MLSILFLAWSGGLHIDDFVKTSIKGRAAGDFIYHRINGVLVDLNLPKGRAVGKMKATITQRFKIQGIECDIDCDSQFLFFCLKTPEGWKAKWTKLFYIKDKLIPVDGKTVPTFSEADLKQFTEGEWSCSQMQMNTVSSAYAFQVTSISPSAKPA